MRVVHPYHAHPHPLPPPHHATAALMLLVLLPHTPPPTEAKEVLQQASRKAPSSALGFRVAVSKWLILVRMVVLCAIYDMRCTVATYVGRSAKFPACSIPFDCL